LIVLLDVVLLAGAWIVYRSIRKEMDLVRMKSDFVSNVSHELRTPLSLIRMYSETLEMGRIVSEERRQEYYSTILGETERLSRLVNNILDFSKMEAGKKQFQFDELDLNTVVSNVVKTYEFQMHSDGVTPVLDLDGAIPPVSADQEAVSQAVINLLDNAIKYGGPEKYLKLSTGTEGGFAFIEVTDRGIGIAPEHQAKIFDTFYRVSTGLVHTTKGSGLGLALVQRIMEAHRGNIRVRSAPGKGSSFRLSFPSLSR
jgi:two-component system, OmpR family, phosphate regulon sensor histidine kinase PhoR